MNKITIVTFLLISCSIFSQVRWEPGYFIDNAGVKSKGLILNRDWNNNPTEFEFKQGETAASSVRTLENTKEFGVNAYSKYIRADVKMDRSSVKMSKIPKDKKPVFNDERLFLKVLVQGNQTLYNYYEGGISKYFYMNAKGQIEQLVFLVYAPDGVQLYENHQFRNQLWNDVKCPDTKLREIEKLRYVESDLVDYFKKVNKCNASTTDETFVTVRNIGEFKYKIIAGVNFMSHKVTTGSASNNSDIKATSPLAGFEIEYILPTQSKRWGVSGGANYNIFKGEQSVNDGNNLVEIKYNFIQLPVWGRYYFPVTTTSKIFLGAGVSANFTSGSSITYNGTDRFKIAGSTFSAGLGAGYNFNKFTIDGRIYIPTKTVPGVSTKFSQVSATVSYHIF